MTIVKRGPISYLRGVSMALVAVGLFGLAVAQKPYQGVSLTVSVWSSNLVNNVFAPLLPEFEEATGIDVTIDDIAWGGLRAKQVIELAGNRGAYDVVLMGEVWVPQYAQGGLLEPLQTVADEGHFEGFIPSILATGQYEGVQYGVPALNHAIGLIYRTDLFEEAGLAAPDTWENVLAAIAVLNDPTNNRYAFAFPAISPTIAELFLAFLRTNGSELFTEDWVPQFDTPAALETYEFLAQLVAATPPGAVSWHWPEARAALYDGVGAMHIGGIAIAPGLDDPTVTRYPGKFAVAPLPTPEAREGESFKSMLLNYSWGIAANSPNQAAAWEFIKWVTGPRVETALAQSGVPLQSDSAQLWYYTDPTVLEARPIATTLFSMYEHSATAPAIPEWAEIAEDLALHLTQALLGQKSPAEALAEANENAEQILRRAGYFD